MKWKLSVLRPPVSYVAIVAIQTLGLASPGPYVRSFLDFLDDTKNILITFYSLSLSTGPYTLYCTYKSQPKVVLTKLTFGIFEILKTDISTIFLWEQKIQNDTAPTNRS